MSERKPAGCWMSPGGARAHRKGHPGWPDVDAADVEAFGLVSVLVTRQERSDWVRLCGWLVDVYCLGQRRGRPTRHGQTPRGRLLQLVLAAYQARPIPAPLELASSWSSARSSTRGPWARARPRLAATTDQTEVVGGPSAISFGCDGKPSFVQGPPDNADAVPQTLERSVGRGNFTFLVQA